MKRVQTLPLSVRDRGDHVSVVIDIGEQAIATWCVELCMLEKRLIESLTVRSDSHDPFSLQIQNGPGDASGATVKWSDQRAKLCISRTELESWIAFFLTYYRDGIASVDHLDVDVPASGKDSTKGIFLVMRVSHALQPVSETEARRRLGLVIQT